MKRCGGPDADPDVPWSCAVRDSGHSSPGVETGLTDSGKVAVYGNTTTPTVPFPRQQATEPSVPIAQVWSYPALTEAKSAEPPDLFLSASSVSLPEELDVSSDSCVALSEDLEDSSDRASWVGRAVSPGSCVAFPEDSSDPENSSDRASRVASRDSSGLEPSPPQAVRAAAISRIARNRTGATAGGKPTQRRMSMGARWPQRAHPPIRMTSQLPLHGTGAGKWRELLILNRISKRWHSRVMLVLE